MVALVLCSAACLRCAARLLPPLTATARRSGAPLVGLTRKPSRDLAFIK